MNKITSLYMKLGILFTTCLLLSNIAAFKLITVGPIVLTSAVILFPLTYIVNDVLAEVYGYGGARRIIWMGFAMNLLMVVFFQLTILWPSPSFFSGDLMYSTVLGNTPRILLASLAAYLVGSFSNAKVLSLLKVKTNGKYLSVRCIGSTLVGEGLDSIIFITIAFVGTMPLQALISMIIAQAVFKVLYETVAYPFTRIVIAKVKRIEGIDTFDI